MSWVQSRKVSLVTGDVIDAAMVIVDELQLLEPTADARFWPRQVALMLVFKRASPQIDVLSTSVWQRGRRPPKPNDRLRGG